jgi:hypothetical protein
MDFQRHTLTLGESCTWIDLSDEVSNTPNIDHMQNLCPREFDVSTTPIGARKPVAFHLPRLGFWIFFIMLKRPLEPHCKHHLLVNERSRHISS